MSSRRQTTKASLEHLTRWIPGTGVSPALGTAPVAVRRTVFLDENCAAHKHELHSEPFFMAVPGKAAHVFDANASPDIVVT
jgi:hypothetical protein